VGPALFQVVEEAGACVVEPKSQSRPSGPQGIACFATHLGCS
jgi:hypothetical protein